MPVQERLLQYLTDNLTRTGSSNPGVARALSQGGAGASPSPTFDFADQYAKQQMPPITPNYQAYQHPRDRYSDVVNAVRQHAMQVGGAGGNAENRLGFVEGESGKNALRGLAAIGQTLGQAMMMRQMMDPGQQYFQPSSGRIINSNPNALDPADRMKLAMQQRQFDYENNLNALKTQAELMNRLSELEANGEQGYESNARGNQVWDTTMRNRATLAPEIYQDITAGQQNESMAGYYSGKDRREDEMQPLEMAVKQSQEAQNLAGARSSNATADRTQFGLETDRALAPIELATKKSEGDIKAEEAKNAPSKFKSEADAAGYKATDAKWKADNPDKAHRPPAQYDTNGRIKIKKYDVLVKQRDAAQKEVDEAQKHAVDFFGSGEKKKRLDDATTKLDRIDSQLRELEGGGDTSEPSATQPAQASAEDKALIEKYKARWGVDPTPETLAQLKAAR